MVYNDYEALFERFSIMTIDGGVSDNEAFDYCSKNTTKELAEKLKQALLSTYVSSNLQNENIGRTSAKLEDKANLEQLAHYIEEGFTLFAKYQNKDGKPVFSNWRKDGRPNTKELSEVKTIEELKQAITNGYERFTFKPMEQNFICLDIDEHEGKPSGIKQFKDLIKSEQLDKIEIFKDFPANFPVYTKSASGNGIHLYFKAQNLTMNRIDNTLHNNNIVLSECEIKYNERDLTTAGSLKNGKEYKMIGSLNNAPELPIGFIKYISKPMKEFFYTPKEKKNYTLDNLIKWGIENSTGGSNNKAYSIGFRVGKLYPLDEIVKECSFLLRSDFTEHELRTSIENGVKNSKY